MEKLSAYPGVSPIVAPCLVGRLIGKVVTYHQVHVARPHADILANDDIARPGNDSDAIACTNASTCSAEACGFNRINRIWRSTPVPREVA